VSRKSTQRSAAHLGLFPCLVAACIGAVLARGASTLFIPWLGYDGVLRLLAVVLPLAYVAFLLTGAPARTGRIALAVTAAAVPLAALALRLDLSMLLLAQGVSIWLVRSLCYRTSVLGALLDGGLVFLGFLLAAATLSSTWSIAWATWAGLLSQCVFVYIPDEWAPTAGAPAAGSEPDPFDRAFRAADAALRDLASR
jgi:hypothetical protein